VSTRWPLKRLVRPSGPGSYGSGIVVFLGAKGTVRENTVEGSTPGHGPLSDHPGAYLEVGISVESGMGSKVGSNRVYRSYIGIGAGENDLSTALAPNPTTVSGNLTLSGFFGILLDSFGATVKQNQSNSNVVGILATSSSTSNTITENKVRFNYGVDCEDDTSDDSSTVLNAWSDNEAGTDDPNGICVTQQP
jgi:hypothetical protein